MSKPKLEWVPSDSVRDLYFANNYTYSVCLGGDTWYAEYEPDPENIKILAAEQDFEAAKAACERHWEKSE